MVTLVYTQLAKQSVTLTSQDDTTSGLQVQVVTDADLSKANLAEPEYKLEPQPESKLVETAENQATSFTKAAIEIQETLDYLEEEKIQGLDTQSTQSGDPTDSEANENEPIDDNFLSSVQVECAIANDSNDLTQLERLELETCEKEIKGGIQSFYRMGKALQNIRSKRLYRSSHSSFADYCSDRWDIARSTTYQLIDAATVVENVRSCGQILPVNEAQARPLVKLKTKDKLETAHRQQQAWQRAIKTAPNGKVTAEHVASVVKDLSPVKQKKSSGKQQPGDFKIDPGSAARDCSVAMQTELPSVKDEVSQKVKVLGLPTSSEQVLPSSPPNDSIPTTSQTHTAALSNTAAIAQGRPDVVAKEIAIGVKHISPEQLDWVITNAAHNGLSDQHLKAAIRAAKRALNSRHHPECFNCKGH